MSLQRRVFVLWMGDNPMTENRKNILDKMESVIKIPVVFIDKNNIHEWILDEAPLHPGFKYLSAVHKADYFRTYLMRFHGGGYADMKRPHGSWVKAFDNMEDNTDIWITSKREQKAMPGRAISYDPEFDCDPDIANLVIEHKGQLTWNGSYICRPNTPFTRDWFGKLTKKMDQKLDILTKRPAKDPRDRRGSRSGYPIAWEELLCYQYHPTVYKHREHVCQSNDVALSTSNYQ